ncbi:hypothetical protein OG542_01120 [Streptomyces violaceus]
MHRVIAPEAPIEQTRGRLARLRTEGVVDRITLPQTGRTRVWFATPRTACNSTPNGPRCTGTGPPEPCPMRPPFGCRPATRRP